MEKGKLYILCNPTIQTPLFSTQTPIGLRSLTNIRKSLICFIQRKECFIFLEIIGKDYKIIYKNKIGYITSKIHCEMVTKENRDLFKETTLV